MHSNPLFRVLRVSKVVYAALEATALLYLNDETESIPVMRMLNTDASEIEGRARNGVKNVKSKFQIRNLMLKRPLVLLVEVFADEKGLPSFAVSVVHPE